MDMAIRAATPAERLYACEQYAQISERCGSPGHLRCELDPVGMTARGHWTAASPDFYTPEFKADFYAVLDKLRFDPQYGQVLRNRATMTACCLDHPESRIEGSQAYIFRADARACSCLIRCIPDSLADNVWIYPYHRDLFYLHMKQAEKGICFISPEGREKFRVPDGESIQITTSGAGTRINTVRYVDACHFLIVTRYGGYLYHMKEFPDWLERHDGRVIPLRSSLPDKCYNVLPGSDEIIIVRKGEDGYCRTDKYGHDRGCAQAIADERNEQLGVSRAQAAAMLAGALSGWDAPAADPKNYDEQGRAVRPRHKDRDGAR